MNANTLDVAGARLRLSGEEVDDVVEIDHRCHMKDSFEVFNEMRRDGFLCDVVVVAEEKRLSAHKVLLSARIPYFRAMFCSDMMESRNNEVYIYEFTYDTTEQLLEYAYTGRVRLSIHNVQAIMTGANFLRIDDLMDECGDYLMKRLSIDNAVAIFVFCRSISYLGIELTVLRFIEKHFVMISRTPDFLELAVDDVIFLLQMDSLYVDGEEQVFTAAMRWIEEDKSGGRKQHAAKLLACVRLPLLQPSFLSDFVAHHFLLRDDIKCRDLVDEAKDYLLMPERRPLLKSFRTIGRVCDQVPALIFVMGGLTTSTRPQPRSQVEVYDAVTDAWTPCKPMTTVRSRIGMAVHERMIYAVGGFDGKDRLDLCEIFDTESNEWSTLPPLHRKRSAMATATLDGIIYVCGGYDGVSSLACVETFDVRRRIPEWRPATKMIKPRSASGSCVLDGVIYVIGGHDGMSIFAGGERYDPQRKVWEEIAPMTTKRCRLGVAALNGKIYAAGGYDGSAFLSSVECYDPMKNAWTPVTNMNIRRCRASLAVTHARLYVIGGFDGFNNLSSCEFYSPEKDAWELRSSLKEHAGGVSVGAVPIPATILTPTSPPVLLKSELDDYNMPLTVKKMMHSSTI
ncbi:hypothetical protein PENTCL1PPCAC_12267 [Pristionchus entomophagus]|uniref:BTB domain-containing protein n=1 Tax=Pristionchus entomophagus TaxID=358040 RepID=A0AAV5T6L7_9BILA|nr:hypothetical protein PENTCL1PPCAC_12267 [Pristionchus entomophagus]